MATDTGFTLAAGWSSGGRITASGSTAVRIRNPNRDTPVFFVITGSDTTPTDEVALGHRISEFSEDDPRASDDNITLADGERLWLATGSGAADITVTTGAVL